MKFLTVTVALLALGAASSGQAADLGVRPLGVAPAAIYNWTGFYIGGHLGGGISSSEALNGILTTSNDGVRLLGGVQAGADYQFGGFVAGVEGQYSWLGGANNGIVFPGGFVYTNERRALGSLTGRAGFAWGPALLYAKGGYAWSDNQERLTFGGVPLAFAFDRNRRDGYTIGAGVEYMFAPNFSAKAEYQYYDFGRSAFVAPAAFVPFGAFRVDEHTVKAGLNYRFNPFSPLIARY